MPPKEQMKLLIAVDFGTTFSAVAYLQTLKHETQTVIQDWGEAGGEGEKVPTILKYDNGQAATPRFGFQISDDETGTIEWFKLGLYNPHVEESELATRYPIKRPNIKDTERHVVNYLKALRQHADTYLTERFGEPFWRSTPKEYIITVPAIWSDKSKASTLNYAEKAGMGPKSKIQIVAEPEAAGIYALQCLENKDLKVGDTFVICDAGGGTVDLVSYTVKELEPVPSVDEAALGSGALCGGTFLNRIFEKYLDDKFADYDPWDSEFRADALRIFEKDIKRKFAGDTNKTYRIRAKGLPDNSHLGIKKGFLEIPGKDIKAVFEPVVKEIIKCVKTQIRATNTANRKVKAVLLAGGFGRNEYLRSRLKSALGDNVEVRKVENSNTSIVRGALIHGLAKKAPNRATFLRDALIARRHYGTRCWLPLKNSNYELKRTQSMKDEVTGETLVDVMQWFLRKNTPAYESQPKPFTFCVDQAVEEGPLQPLNLDVFISEDRENTGAPDYPGNNSDMSIVRLNPDFSNIPPALLNQELGRDGRMYYKVYFVVEMTLRSASLDFVLIHNGKRIQSISTKFE